MLFEEKDKIFDIVFGIGEVNRIVGQNVIVHFSCSDLEYEYDQRGCMTECARRTLYFKQFDFVIPEEATIKPRFRADYNKTYYFVNSTGMIETGVDMGNSTDIKKYDIGNYFRNESTAKESKIYKVMNEAYDEL